MADSTLTVLPIYSFKGFEGHKKFDGALVFRHSLEYFSLLHHDRVSRGRPSCFRLALATEELDCHACLREHSQVFLVILNATGHRCLSVPYDIFMNWQSW